MKTLIDTKTIDHIIDVTNKKLVAWYIQAKEDFGIVGKANTFFNFESNNLCVTYTENGEEKLFSYPLLYVLENMAFSDLGEEYFFELWATIAE